MISTSKSMRTGLVSRMALGAAVALGVASAGAVLAPPAMAAKAPKEPKQAPLKLSAGFQKLAGPLQEKINKAKDRPEVAAAGNNQQALASALATEKSELDQLFAAASNNDDQFIAGQFAVSLGGVAQDPALQRRGVTAMLESGSAPASEIPKLHFYAGQLAYQAKDYAAARAGLQAAIDAGYTENDVQVLLAESYIADNQTPQGLTLLKQAIDQRKASGGSAPASWYRRGLGLAYQAKATDKAAEFAIGLVQSYPTAENWGPAITIVREVGRFPSQEMIDLLRLMGRTNSYAEGRDYLEYIEAADPRRLPGEVVKVLDAGTSSGKLNASDPTVSEMRSIATGRLAADKASLPSLERDARAANATPVTTLAAGDAFLSYGQAAKAEELYSLALGKAGVDTPRALTRLGIAQVDQGKYAEAQANFAKITGQRKMIADLWLAYAAGKAKGPATAAAQ